MAIWSEPKKSMSIIETENIVSFIRNYAEEAALFMPGRLSSQLNIVKLLPSSDQKYHCIESTEYLYVK